jgi:hypothetical protein
MSHFVITWQPIADAERERDYFVLVTAAHAAELGSVTRLGCAGSAAAGNVCGRRSPLWES